MWEGVGSSDVSGSFYAPERLIGSSRSLVPIFRSSLSRSSTRLADRARALSVGNNLSSVSVSEKHSSTRSGRLASKSRTRVRFLTKYDVNQKSLKMLIIFLIIYFRPSCSHLSSSDGDRKRAVRDPGRSPCAPDLHLPKPSRHRVLSCIYINFYPLAIKPLIWSGMMFCVRLESMHPSRQ